jgi:hypothetical protein
LVLLLQHLLALVVLSPQRVLHALIRSVLQIMLHHKHWLIALAIKLRRNAWLTVIRGS